LHHWIVTKFLWNGATPVAPRLRLAASFAISPGPAAAFRLPPDVLTLLAALRFSR